MKQTYKMKCNSVVIKKRSTIFHLDMKQKGIQKVIDKDLDVPIKSSDRKSSALTAEEIATKAIQEANGFVVSN
jgi:hypothetical protein